MWIAIIAIASALIPIVITAFELITTDKHAVVFLQDYNPIVAILILVYYGLILALGVFWLIKQIKSIVRLKTEKTKTELMHLQSQVNPHFFFNTLNNLYGLVGKDSGKAQELILKLSDMMRYSIYEGEKDSVTLQEEVDYLKNYAEIHEMRYHKKIDINFDCKFDAEYKLMPLLFIILLENAFKHGVENLRVNAFVNISVETVKDEIRFSVENNFDASEVAKKPGIGLENLKRRLEIVYPKKHDIHVSIAENVYKAQLILKRL